MMRNSVTASLSMSLFQSCYAYLSSRLFFPVDDGAIMDVQFSKFYHEPPPGFEEIMIEQSLL